MPAQEARDTISLSLPLSLPLSSSLSPSLSLSHTMHSVLECLCQAIFESPNHSSSCILPTKNPANM